jgi:hypothetical protein
MGIFKKLGSAVKKGVKQISLKNVVKIGTPLLSMIPMVGGIASTVVGGISDAHAAKKQAKEIQQAQAQADAQALAIQAQQLQEAGQQAQAQAMQQKSIALTQKSNALAQEAGAMVGQQAGSVFNAFTKGMTNEAILQTNEGFKQSAGIVGASVVNSTMNEWLKSNWWKVAAAAGGLFAIVKIAKK